MIVLFVGSSLASSVGPNDRIAVDLVGGASIEGWFRGCSEHSVVVTSGGRTVDVRLTLVEAVAVSGQSWSPEILIEACDSWRSALSIGEGTITPAPWIPATASALLWSGAGFLWVGEPKEAIGYSVVEGALIGAAAFSWFYQESAGATASILLIDGLVRVVAAQESSRVALRRRRHAQLHD